jgi:EmrB/QacA subfamily drug resistance transporter
MKSTKDHKWLILITVMIASFMGRLDGTIVNLALPKIISEFGITVSQAAWISTAYIIANAIFVPIFGKLGDLIGRKGLYLFGIIGFTITSALAGLSFNYPSLVALRVLQAITVSIDYPLALSIIAYTFRDAKQRTQAMGIWSAIFASAVVFGPLLGGPLIDLFNWRSVFYINIPIGIIATVMAYVYIKESVTEIKGIKDFDYLGSLLLGTGLATLVLVLDQGQGWGWNSFNSWLSYIITFALLALFIFVEKRAKEPVVDLKFFKIPTFTSSIITSFISFAGFISAVFLIPIFAQSYLGYSVTKAGYLFIPMALGMGIFAQIGARLSYKFPARYVTATGMLLCTLSMFLLMGIDIKWGFWDLSLRLLIFTIGMGIGLAPLTNAATQSVPLHEVGIASSVLALARNISGAFGIAISATIFSNSIDSNLLNVQRFTIVNTYDLNVLHLTTGLMSLKATILSFGAVFKFSMILMLIAGISALFLKDPAVKISKKAPIVEI